MGVALSNPTIFEATVKTRFRSNSCPSYCFEIFVLLTVLVIPFIIGFTTGDFWIERSTFVAIPEVSYTGRCLLKAVTASGDQYLWSSSEDVLDALQGDPRFANMVVQEYAEDRDRDGKMDVFHFTFRFPKRSASDSFQSFEFLPTFTYKVDDFVLNLEMESGPFVSHAIVNPAGQGKLTLDGRIRFAQNKPINADSIWRYDVVYKNSYLDAVKDPSDIVGIGRYARRYAARNESSPFELDTAFLSDEIPDAALSHPETYVPAVPSGKTAAAFFTVSVTMRVQPAEINYIPILSQTLKFAWIQYFCIAYVIHWFFGFVRELFVTQAWINTIAVFEGRYRES